MPRESILSFFFFLRKISGGRIQLREKETILV